jgi:hypothetical protein
MLDFRIAVGGSDLRYKLAHGYHGRALNANGPGTHYRDVCVLNVVGPQYLCDSTDPDNMIEGTPLQKGYIYDQELWDRFIWLGSSQNLPEILH